MTTAVEVDPAPRSEDRMRSRVERAFIDACLLDVTAIKPGNVGVHAPGHGMEAPDFVRSARAAAPAIAAEGASVGERIHGAVSATRAAVGSNTNLGIALLTAPIARAAQTAAAPLSHKTLSDALRQVLEGLTIADASLAFDAICLANPGGLGEAARHDVRQPARVSLLDAMREAADRDSIARQYATAYADVVEIGLARLASSRGRGRRWAATEVFLSFLSSRPDSHVARKFGLAQAQALCKEAQLRLETDLRRDARDGELEALRQWDVDLKSRGLNPGTSADLTVATLFWGLLLESD